MTNLTGFFIVVWFSFLMGTCFTYYLYLKYKSEVKLNKCLLDSFDKHYEIFCQAAENENFEAAQAALEDLTHTVRMARFYAKNEMASPAVFDKGAILYSLAKDRLTMIS